MWMNGRVRVRRNLFKYNDFSHCLVAMSTYAEGSLGCQTVQEARDLLESSSYHRFSLPKGWLIGTISYPYGRSYSKRQILHLEIQHQDTEDHEVRETFFLGRSKEQPGSNGSPVGFGWYQSSTGACVFGTSRLSRHDLALQVV